MLFQIQLNQKETLNIMNLFTDSLENTIEIPLIDYQLNDINPRTVGYEECSPKHFFGPVIRGFYMFHYVYEGKGYFEREKENETHTIQEGNLFLIRPHEITKYYADKKTPWKYIWIGFVGTKIHELIQNSEFSDNRCVVDAPFVSSVFFDIKENIKIQSNFELYLCGKIYELFSILCLKPNNSFSQNNYLKQAVHYINCNYNSNNISIEKIANVLNINRRHLSRLFITILNKTPKEYLTEVKLNNAKKLLTQTDYNIAQISQFVGYNDPYNFSRIFSKFYSIPPIEYRKKHQKSTSENN